MRWDNNPSSNFGSNHVDLGGITLFASATFISDSIGVGKSAKAISKPSLSTLFSSSFKPLAPPTKSILGSVLSSVMPSKGSIIKSWSIETSRDSTGSIEFIFSWFVVYSYQ